MSGDFLPKASASLSKRVYETWPQVSSLERQGLKEIHPYSWKDIHFLIPPHTSILRCTSTDLQNFHLADIGRSPKEKDQRPRLGKEVK